MKKLLKWALILFLVFFVARHPAEAAAIGRNLVSGAAGMGVRFSDFVAHLASHSS